MELNAIEIIPAILNFLILFWLLKKFLYKPVLNMLEARENEIAENLTSADIARTEAESMRSEYESNLRDAQAKANDIIQQAAQLGESTRNEIVMQAKSEAQMVAEKAKLEIEREKEKALQDLRGEVANLAVDVAEKVVGRTVTVQDHDQLLSSFLQEAEGVK